MDQELVDALGRHCVCTHQMAAALFCMKCCHGGHLDNVIWDIQLHQINAYLLEEQSCKISSQCIRNNKAFGFFLKRSPGQEEQDD